VCAYIRLAPFGAVFEFGLVVHPCCWLDPLYRVCWFLSLSCGSFFPVPASAKVLPIVTFKLQIAIYRLQIDQFQRRQANHVFFMTILVQSGIWAGPEFSASEQNQKAVTL